MFDIVCERLGKTFNQREQEKAHHTLTDLSATFVAGKISAVVGESGCGKTTLLRILAGLTQPDSGSVFYRSTNNAHKSRPKIATVFQEPRLFPWLTVEENVALAVRNFPERQRKERTAQTLAVVGLADRSQALVHELSGGMAQRAGFARALVCEPDILLLDEAFSALDALTRDRLRSEFVRIWQTRPMTVVLVTHDIWEAVLLSENIFKLSDGALTRISSIDTPYPRRMDDERMAREASVLMQSFFGTKD